jgi:hypothetical protein
MEGMAVELPAMNNYEDLMQACCCIGPKKAYLVDLPRGMKKEKLSQFFTGLESLKNGVVYDKRYAFRKVRFNRPQVIVFSNSMPDVSLMSMDRWDMYRILSDHSLQRIHESEYMAALRPYDDTDDPPRRRRRVDPLFVHNGDPWRDHAQARL